MSVTFPRHFTGAVPAEIRECEINGKRIYTNLEIRVENFTFKEEVMIDTGGLYLMLRRDFASNIRDELTTSPIEKKKVSFRGRDVEGDIFLLPVTFPVVEGKIITLEEMHVFLPQEDSEWKEGSPSVLGLEGALDKMFFAFDRLWMRDGRFYIGKDGDS
jgi:hypothetical protein